jgi:hypothetical protein
MAAPLDPFCLFQVLAAHDVDYVLIGGLAAVIHGSSATTNDADIVPSQDPANLEGLSAALRDLKARLRVDRDPRGVRFDPHPALLASMSMLNLTTRCGDLDLTFSPAAIDDYAALRRDSTVFDIEGTYVRVASLTDIIRSKETADRPKDRAVLPILRALQDELRRRPNTP